MRLVLLTILIHLKCTFFPIGRKNVYENQNAQLKTANTTNIVKIKIFSFVINSAILFYYNMYFCVFWVRNSAVPQVNTLVLIFCFPFSYRAYYKCLAFILAVSVAIALDSVWILDRWCSMSGYSAKDIISHHKER